jgi:hypothetical protein
LGRALYLSETSGLFWRGGFNAGQIKVVGMAQSSRIGALDFWRGLVLIAILFDHIPGNWLENITPRNYGFSDSAEAFVFLSGLAVGVIYVARARKAGVFEVVVACLRRALKLYGVHLATTAAALAIFGLATLVTGVNDLVAAHGRSLVFDNPARGVAAIAALSHQIGYFNILPLYIALMIWAPVAVVMTLTRPWLALAVSFALYVATRAWGWNLPTWPEDGHWFFNPLAWQLLFTAGVAVADLWRAGPPPLSAPFVVASVALLIAGALVVTDAFGLAAGLRAGVSSIANFGKQNLGVLRIAHFFALAYLVSAIPSLVRLANAEFGEGLRQLGRNSLPIFAFGSLYAAVGQALTGVSTPFLSQILVHALEMLYTILGVSLSFLLAYRLECKPSFPLASSLLVALRLRSRRAANLRPSSQRG